jgi:hypothetical protein
MRRSVYSITVCVLLTMAPALWGQSDVNPDLEQKVDQHFALTKFTADKADIVTAGAVLVLQKDNLVLYTASVPAPPINTYKSGKLSQGFSDMLSVDMSDRVSRASTGSIPKKVLVSGQKVWLSRTAVTKDKLVLTVITDPYDDGRYAAQVKFQFAKGTPPSADDLLKTISEVFTVQPGDNAPASGSPPQQAMAPIAPPAPAEVMAPIAPPPPPADAPPAATKTISLGQTKDQVVAIFGAPQKVVKLGKKEIVYYPDMKVTLVDGKVSDVQ